MDSLHVLSLLDNTLIILTNDHGHSIGDRGYVGKSGRLPTLTRMWSPELARLVQHQARRTTRDSPTSHSSITRPVSADLIAAS